MKKKFFMVVLIGVFLGVPHETLSADVAVIVNKSNPETEFSFREVTRIFKMEKKYWKDGRKIYFVMQEAGALEKQIILKKVFKMNAQQLKKFWLAKIFRAEISSFPKTLGSNESVIRFVREVPYAVGFINASSLDKSIKVLAIDGKRPGQVGYLLTDQ